MFVTILNVTLVFRHRRCDGSHPTLGYDWNMVKQVWVSRDHIAPVCINNVILHSRFRNAWEFW